MGRGLVALAMAAALLTGCGDKGGDATGDTPAPTPSDNGVAALAPEQALERAKSAMVKAKSYRVKGNVDADGERMSLDFRVAGTDLGGRLTMGDGTIELLSVANQQYIRPDAKFWAKSLGPNAADDAVKLMGDKWAKMPPKNKDFADFFGVANVDELLKPGGALSKGQPKDIDGVPTVGLVDTADKGSTLYVATTGEPYPIRMEGSKTEEGQITFSDFGATFDDLQAPPEAKVVDFEQLKRK